MIMNIFCISTYLFLDLCQMRWERRFQEFRWVVMRYAHFLMAISQQKRCEQARCHDATFGAPISVSGVRLDRLSITSGWHSHVPALCDSCLALIFHHGNQACDAEEMTNMRFPCERDRLVISVANHLGLILRCSASLLLCNDKSLLTRSRCRSKRTSPEAFSTILLGREGKLAGKNPEKWKIWSVRKG